MFIFYVEAEGSRRQQRRQTEGKAKKEAVSVCCAVLSLSNDDLGVDHSYSASLCWQRFAVRQLDPGGKPVITGKIMVCFLIFVNHNSQHPIYMLSKYYVTH